MSDFVIRRALPADAPTLCRLIDGLAEFERLSHESNPDARALASHLSPDANPRCDALVAEDRASGRALGFALFFPNYSTFLTGWGIYLEDLFVEPEARGRGIGKALLAAVAREAVLRGARRLDWSVLTWNEGAIGFYQSIGAKPMDDWKTMRLSGEALRTFCAD